MNKFKKHLNVQQALEAVLAAVDEDDCNKSVKELAFFFGTKFSLSYKQEDALIELLKEKNLL